MQAPSSFLSSRGASASVHTIRARKEAFCHAKDCFRCPVKQTSVKTGNPANTQPQRKNGRNPLGGDLLRAARPGSSPGPPTPQVPLGGECTAGREAPAGPSGTGVRPTAPRPGTGKHEVTPGDSPGPRPALAPRAAHPLSTAPCPLGSPLPRTLLPTSFSRRCAPSVRLALGAPSRPAPLPGTPAPESPVATPVSHP